MLSADIIVGRLHMHSSSGPLISRSFTLNCIDRARVSADEHMPILFSILISCVDPPPLSIASVISVWKGTEHRSSVQNIRAERQIADRPVLHDIVLCVVDWLSCYTHVCQKLTLSLI